MRAYCSMHLFKNSQTAKNSHYTRITTIVGKWQRTGTLLLQHQNRGIVFNIWYTVHVLHAYSSFSVIICISIVCSLAIYIIHCRWRPTRGKLWDLFAGIIYIIGKTADIASWKKARMWMYLKVTELFQREIAKKVGIRQKTESRISRKLESGLSVTAQREGRCGRKMRSTNHEDRRLVQSCRINCKGTNKVLQKEWEV